MFGFSQNKFLCEDFQSKLWALYRIPLKSIPSSSSKLNYNCLHDCFYTLLIPCLGSNCGFWSLDSMFLAQYLSHGRHSSNSCWVKATAVFPCCLSQLLLSIGQVYGYLSPRHLKVRRQSAVGMRSPPSGSYPLCDPGQVIDPPWAHLPFLQNRVGDVTKVNQTRGLAALAQQTQHWTSSFAMEKLKPFYLQGASKENWKLLLKTWTPWWRFINSF